MKRNIILHGELAERFGKSFALSVKTAHEAVRALAIQIPGFGQAVHDGAWHVVRTKPNSDDPDAGTSLDEDMLDSFQLGRGDLHIMPVVAGSKRSGLLKIILGVALIGGAFIGAAFGGGLAAPLAASGAMHSITWGNVAMIGLAVAAAGVSEMMAPDEETEKKEESYLFSGPQNTYAEGAPVPLVYGEVYTGGVLISIGMDVEDIPIKEVD